MLKDELKIKTILKDKKKKLTRVSMLNLWLGCDIRITSYKKKNTTIKWKNLKKPIKKH